MPTEQRHWPWSLWEDSQELWGKARRVGPRYTLTLAALSITLLHTHRKPACWFLQQEDQERGTQKILAHSKFFSFFFHFPPPDCFWLKAWEVECESERGRGRDTHQHIYIIQAAAQHHWGYVKKFPSSLHNFTQWRLPLILRMQGQTSDLTTAQTHTHCI